MAIRLTQLKATLKAAENMDWQQVVLNGGPPCFHLEDGRFCGRAERWAGHDGNPHKFVRTSRLTGQDHLVASPFHAIAVGC